MRIIVCVIGAMLIATTANAQDNRIRWNVALGPSGILGNNGVVPPPGNSFSFQAGDPIISGANQGRFNLGVGLSRPLTGALQWRLDMIYHLGTSEPATNYTPCNGAQPSDPFFTCGWARPALRDELLLGTLGFQWDALPKSRWSPYLLTTTGVALSRLQWSRDHTSSTPSETSTSRGVVFGYGLGARFPLWRYEGFVETRRHRSTHIYSSKFVPLSLGIRF